MPDTDTMTDETDITIPMWRCKKCGERFEDAIEMPASSIQEPGKDIVHKPAARYCPFCRSDAIERWK